MTIGRRKKREVLQQRFDDKTGGFRRQRGCKGVDLLPEKEPVKSDVGVTEEDLSTLGWLKSELGDRLEYGKEEGLG